MSLLDFRVERKQSLAFFVGIAKIMLSLGFVCSCPRVSNVTQ